LLLLAICLVLTAAFAISWLSGAWLFGFVVRWWGSKPPSWCLDEKTLCEGWNILADDIVINVLLNCI
jgi:hypothetical protein